MYRNLSPFFDGAATARRVAARFTDDGLTVTNI